MAIRLQTKAVASPCPDGEGPDVKLYEASGMDGRILVSRKKSRCVLLNRQTGESGFDMR